MFFGGAKNIPSLKWANGGDIKEVVDAKMLEILGPKDERDVVVKKVNPTNCCLNTDFSFLPDQRLPWFSFLASHSTEHTHFQGNNNRIESEPIHNSVCLPTRTTFFFFVIRINLSRNSNPDMHTFSVFLILHMNVN